jgi:uncharacterized protein YbbK (DUF523 family)
MKPKAIVSACILGEYCRYDGKTKQVDEVIKALEGYEVIPFCPEAPLFGTPRQRIDVVNVDGEERIITHETKEDVTQLLACEIESFIHKYRDVELVVLKSKSPSCGMGTTPILDQKGDVLACGDGIAAKILQGHYAHAIFKDEKSFMIQNLDAVD